MLKRNSITTGFDKCIQTKSKSACLFVCVSFFFWSVHICFFFLLLLQIVSSYYEQIAEVYSKLSVVFICFVVVVLKLIIILLANRADTIHISLNGMCDHSLVLCNWLPYSFVSCRNLSTGCSQLQISLLLFPLMKLFCCILFACLIYWKSDWFGSLLNDLNSINLPHCC